MLLTIAEIAQAAGGRVLQGDPATPVARFITDSREAAPGAMFVPIRGERTDGHRYIASVFEGGAAASFTDHVIPEVSGPLVLVEDCRMGLQKAAAAYRERFTLPIVGITGSVGKTSAKEMVAQALTAGFEVMKTAGNQNSQVGVPITICGLESRHTAAVVEMGVSMPGEMGRIAPVVKPTCGVITNIGVSHIEFLGSRENILREKSRMADFLPSGGVLFVNGDNDLLSAFGDTVPYRVATFGLGDPCDWRAEEITETENGTSFMCKAPGGRETPVYIPAIGAHNVRNALAALAVADHLGLPAEDAARALAGYTPPAMRQQIMRLGGVTVIDDSYNASPDSMCSAIDVLVSRTGEGKRIAALADMLELGPVSQQEHARVGAYAREKGVTHLLAVGPLSKDIAQGFGPQAQWFRSNADASSALCELLAPGDAVLVKGSRGMHTEEIVAALKNRA